ncbi:unannotated protein [freshwater metagenome]|uniref:Unannotated protein n=1 Tax=freshwater metagenome TaxID=449393 RepID=A0A6J6EN06_9ZZZZ
MAAAAAAEVPTLRMVAVTGEPFTITVAEPGNWVNCDWLDEFTNCGAATTVVVGPDATVVVGASVVGAEPMVSACVITPPGVVMEIV